MEFTRPMDRDLDSVRKTDEQEDVKYSRLRQALERTLQPGWRVQIATFSIGVRGTIAKVNWKNSLAKVGVPTSKHDHIARRAIIDALKGDLLGIVVQPLDLHLANVGSIPTSPTHGEGRLEPYPGDTTFITEFSL